MPEQPLSSNKQQYSLGDMVSLRGDNSLSGAVIDILPGVPETRYRVYLGGAKGSTTLYGSQIEIREATEAPTISQHVPLREFQARLTALQLTEPSLSNLYSLHAARVNYVPYQFRPVLKFIRADRPRLLIADEVGVGKTIESGLILREMQSRQEVNSVLIICPKPLVTESKWRKEMMRFDEHFEHINGQTLRHCIAQTDRDGEWPQRYSKGIIPFSLFDDRLLHGNGVQSGSRRELGLLELDPAPKFDLVIVDEAHYLRNPSTKVHAGVRYFTDNANAVIFMSATPIQLRTDELFVLLNLLRPDVVIDRETFAHMSEPNGAIHNAVSAARRAETGWAEEARTALINAGDTEWGRNVLIPNPDFTNAIATVSKNAVSDPDRLSFVREAENLNSFTHMINRTRRRDIGSYFTTRSAETIEVPFTADQQQLHDLLLATQAEIFKKKHGQKSVGFLMSTLRRQASSCLFALAPFVEEILSRHVSNEDWLEAYSGFEEEEPWEDIDEDTYGSIGNKIQKVLNLAKNLDNKNDPKRDALLKIVRDKQQRSNNKVLVFSSFRHTLRYLIEHLSISGVRVGLVQGDVPDEERTSIRERFSLDSKDTQAFDVLLSSEVGCEGLDYQFCDTLVNFDLPWNPQKIEQRIGRIDRYGQESEVVAIYNIVTPGTVDFDIYDRCMKRIGVFREALGGSEEILGEITRQLRDVAENLSLTEDQRKERLQQIADNQIRILQEEAQLEARQSELFGIVLPPNHIEQEVKDATSAWLSPAALQNLIQQYLTQLVGGAEHIVGNQAIKTLRLSGEARNMLLEDHRTHGRRSTSPVVREWERWLKDGDQRLDITFDSQAASNHRRLVFITPVHPLAQQAAHGVLHRTDPIASSQLRRTRLAVHNAEVSPGEYAFSIYQWKRRGFRDDTELQPIALDPIVTSKFFELVNAAGDDVSTPSGSTSQLDIAKVDDMIEAIHYERWREARENHHEQTRRVAAFRRQSLTASFAARSVTLNEQIAMADNPRIRKMKQSQANSAAADFDRRITEIAEAEAKSDIVAERIAVGELVVTSASALEI